MINIIQFSWQSEMLKIKLNKHINYYEDGFLSESNYLKGFTDLQYIIDIKYHLFSYHIHCCNSQYKCIFKAVQNATY